MARLADDHRRAADLAAGLAAIPRVTVLGQHTNMVFIEVPAERLAALGAHLAAAGVVVGTSRGPKLRLVTHLDIDDAGIARAVAAFAAFFR